MKTQDAPSGIKIKRVYDLVEPCDGHRVLVDRLWPRGVTREAAALDDWAKIITPGIDLRVWYGHLPDRWDEFQIRYRLELSRPEQVAELKRLAQIAREQKTNAHHDREQQNRKSCAGPKKTARPTDGGLKFVVATFRLVGLRFTSYMTE